MFPSLWKLTEGWTDVSEFLKLWSPSHEEQRTLQRPLENPRENWVNNPHQITPNTVPPFKYHNVIGKIKERDTQNNEARLVPTPAVVPRSTIQGKGSTRGYSTSQISQQTDAILPMCRTAQQCPLEQTVPKSQTHMGI